MNRLAFVFSLVLWLCIQCRASSQQKQLDADSPELILRFDVLHYHSDEKLLAEAGKNVRDQKLYAFCQRGILWDIGFARNYFWADNSDTEIARKLLPDAKFKEALAKSLAIYEYTADPPAQELDLEDKKSGAKLNEVWRRYQPRNAFRTSLVKELSADERIKLLGVYLRLEGMMAICRPDFLKLFETPEKRQAVRDMVEKEYASRISGMHRAIFLLEGQERTMILAHLRRAVVDLDCQIILALSDVERDRVASCIDRSENLDSAINLSRK